MRIYSMICVPLKTEKYDERESAFGPDHGWGDAGPVILYTARCFLHIGRFRLTGSGRARAENPAPKSSPLAGTAEPDRATDGLAAWPLGSRIEAHQTHRRKTCGQMSASGDDTPRPRRALSRPTANVTCWMAGGRRPIAVDQTWVFM